jgi:protein-arginine kinase activator protein McsA
MEKLKEVVGKALNLEDKQAVKTNVCTLCGKPASQLVDGEPSCAEHIEQVYEHQVEDYTSRHLSENDWRKP